MGGESKSFAATQRKPLEKEAAQAMTDASADSILVERGEHHAAIVFNRPERRNALSLEMWKRLGALLEAFNADPKLRLIVLKGADETAFASGADISEFPKVRADAAQAKAYAQAMKPALDNLHHCPIPTLAIIQGVCVGGGLELAALCDLRIAGEASRFGIPINRIGHVLPYPATAALVELIGRSNTLEILLEGRVFGSAEAKAMGLINRVVPDANLAEESGKMIARIVAGAPIAARLHKKMAARVLKEAPITEAEIDEAFGACDSADYSEGVAAFIEKRKPVFSGR
jgi:enoyl-CoA hydratase/carnithine racemase